MAVNALGFLDSICITVFMALCDIVGISDRLADHDSLSTQRNFQGKQLSRVVTLVLDHAIAAIQTSPIDLFISVRCFLSAGRKSKDVHRHKTIGCTGNTAQILHLLQWCFSSMAYSFGMSVPITISTNISIITTCRFGFSTVQKRNGI